MNECNPLSNGRKSVVRLFILLSIIFGLATINSCHSGLNIPKSTTKPIILSFSGTFYNECYDVKYETKETSILELFNITQHTSYDLVHLRFIDHRHIEIVAFNSKNLENKRRWVLKGRFRRPGYFKITLDRFSFLCDFCFGQLSYDKIRVGLTHKGNLVIRNDSDKSVYIDEKGNEVTVALINTETYYFKAVDNDFQYRFD